MRNFTSVPVTMQLAPLYEQRFGVRTALSFLRNVDALPELIDFCHTHDAHLLIVRCATHDKPAVHALEAAGCRLMDTLLYFRRDLKNGDLPDEALDRGLQIRPAMSGDADDVERIAAGAFSSYDGHFHADPRLERSACEAVYTSWARSSILSDDTADHVLVAEDAGAVIGFLTLKLTTPEIGEGPLYAVADDYQGRGLGRAMMVRGMQWLRDQHVDWMEMSTQVTNARSQRVWLRLGFEPSHSIYTFHKWFDE